MARSRARQQQRESGAAETMTSQSVPIIGTQDREIVLRFLDDELNSLSAVQRDAVIFRYLDGLSERDAAALAGCTPNTLSCRASEGISNLRKRLLKRGCTLGVPALVAFLEADSQAAIPQTLIPSLLAVPKLAEAGATAGTASANIINIMEGALKTMAISKIKAAAIGILIALLIGTTGVVVVREIQKRQVPGASGKPDIVASPAKQKVEDQSESSKLETKDKT